MYIVHMGHKILSSPFEGILIRKANVTFAISFMLYLLFGISLLGELIDDDGSDDVTEENFEKSPIYQIGDKSAVVILLVLSANTLADDFLGVE